MGVDELRCISARCGPRLGPARRHRVGTVPGLELLGRRFQNGGQSQHHLVRSGPKKLRGNYAPPTFFNLLFPHIKSPPLFIFVFYLILFFQMKLSSVHAPIFLWFALFCTYFCSRVFLLYSKVDKHHTKIHLFLNALESHDVDYFTIMISLSLFPII